MIEKVNLNDYIKAIPEIGFGPGIVRRSTLGKNIKNAYASLLFKVVNKFIISPINERQFVNAVSESLNVGFRLIDYSSAYGNGELLSKALKKSCVSRTELFITGRVSNQAQFNNSVKQEVYSYIKNMNLDYLDLLQFHWPVPEHFIHTWTVMEQLKDEGVVRYLGVANCNEHHIEDILKICKYPPEIAQFEIHPLFTQKKLIDYYKSKHILVEAYTPVARYDERLVRLPLLHNLEEKYHKTFAQIILRWHIQNGCIPLIRSMNPRHIKENFDVFDFKLEDVDMKAIDGLNINSRLRYDPDNCDFSIL